MLSENFVALFIILLSSRCVWTGKNQRDLQPILTPADVVLEGSQKRKSQQDFEYTANAQRFFQVISKNMKKLGAVCLNQKDKCWSRRWQRPNTIGPGKIFHQ